MTEQVSETVRLLQGLVLLRGKIMDELKAKLTDPIGLELRIQEVHKASAVFAQLDKIEARLSNQP